MQSRSFNGSGRTVSEVGLGCWQLGGSDWGDVSEQDAFETLTAAVESRVTFFDTADVYGGGRSETLIGAFLKETKSPVFVATKLGRFSPPGGDANCTEKVFREHTEASLRRLGVDALDLTQLHCVATEQLRRGDVFEWLRDLQKQGKIKSFGASVESMEQAEICLKQDGLAALQIIFNIFRQKPIGTIFEEAKHRNVAIIVRLPLASGLLSGKMTKQTTFAAGDHRTYNRDGQAFNVGETFAGLPFETGVDLADRLRPLLVGAGDATMAQLALRWCLDYDAVTTIIPGAKNAEMAKANAAASEIPPLTSELHRSLAEFYDKEVAKHIRGPY
jgi:aryl-alcohol dehydrogenase-like predicted oxidoreductase